MASSSTTTAAGRVGPMDADDELRGSRSPTLISPVAAPPDRHPVEQPLGARVEERLHHGSAWQAPRPDVEEGVGALVRVVDPALGVEVDDADGQELLERRSQSRRPRLGPRRIESHFAGGAAR